MAFGVAGGGLWNALPPGPAARGALVVPALNLGKGPDLDLDDEIDATGGANTDNGCGLRWLVVPAANFGRPFGLEFATFALALALALEGGADLVFEFAFAFAFALSVAFAFEFAFASAFVVGVGVCGGNAGSELLARLMRRRRSWAARQEKAVCDLGMGPSKSMVAVWKGGWENLFF